MEATELTDRRYFGRSRSPDDRVRAAARLLGVDPADYADLASLTLEELEARINESDCRRALFRKAAHVLERHSPTVF